jgi:ABC-type Na+ efflux pump permease subunit
MRLSFCLGLAFLLISVPVYSQTTSTDSQTLQALLAEVRHLREDLQTTSAASLRAQILLYRIHLQENALALATQRLDSVGAKLDAIASEKKHQASEIKRHEHELDNSDISPAQRKEIENSLPAFKTRLESLQADEQEQQTRVTQAEEQQRLEQAKLDTFQGQLSQLVDALDKTGQTSHH